MHTCGGDLFIRAARHECSGVLGICCAVVGPGALPGRVTEFEDMRGGGGLAVAVGEGARAATCEVVLGKPAETAE